MTILNIHCLRPLIPTGTGSYFRKADICKEYDLPYDYSRDYNCTHEQVEYKKAVWLQMLETIERLGDKATAANIRAEMGWGTNASRSHCDYFSTLKYRGEIDWSYKMVDGKKKPVYCLTNIGKSTISYAHNKLSKALTEAEKRGTKRLTKEEFAGICRRRVVANQKREIIKEATCGF